MHWVMLKAFIWLVFVSLGLGPGLKDEEDLQVIDLSPEGGIEMAEGTETEETRATINIYNCIEWLSKIGNTLNEIQISGIFIL